MKHIYTILLIAIALLTSCDNKYPADIENSTSEHYIEYTSISIDEEMQDFSADAFGAKIIVHTWENGVGRIYFNKPIQEIGDDAFRDCSNLTSINIPNSVTSIGEDAFYDCISLTSITIPNSVTTIGEDAFNGCSSLTSITIPNSVTSIGGSAFYYCSSLTSITIPNSVTSIGGSAFYGCSSLTSITIGNGVTSIGYMAFYDCSSLTSITIGNGVTSIGRYAFCYCSSLTSVYCKATTPPALESGDFGQNGSGRKIYVPRNSVSAYKSAKGWSTYAADIVGYDF